MQPEQTGQTEYELLMEQLKEENYSDWEEAMAINNTPYNPTYI